MDVRNEWLASSQLETFELTGNDRRSQDYLEFDSDRVEFHFSRKMGSDEPVTAYVKLTDPVKYIEFGQSSVTIEPDTTLKTFLSISGFGWRDESMAEPIGQCAYEVWLEGSEDIQIDVEVWT